MPKVVREGVDVLRNMLRETRRIEENGAYGSLEDSILKPQELDEVMAKV